MTLLQDFKKFLLRGNLIDLAVAVVVGTAFAALIKALVADILTPIIALIFGKPNFSALSFTINSSHFLYGDFLNNLITFVSVAAAVYFFVIVPVDTLMERRKRGAAPEVRDCPECLSEVPVAAKRCAFCTAEIGPALAG
jgi:large conductance mechanosensitive channel